MNRRSQHPIARPARFSRKSLNVIIVVVAIMIAIFSQMGERPPPNHTDNSLLAQLEQTPYLDPQPLDIDIQHWQHPSGAPVYFIHSPNVPMLDVRILLNAGSARDGQHPGLAKLTASLLDEGTETLDVEQIAEAFERIGAQLGASAHRDMAVISLRTLTLNNYDTTALNLLQQILRNPTFPQPSIDRIKAQMHRYLDYQKQQPGNVLSRAMWQHLYPSHPYGTPPEGTHNSINSLTQDLVKQHYDTYYVAANSSIAMIGAISKEKAERIAHSILSAFNTGSKAPSLPTPKFLPSQQIHIPFPSQQTHVRIAQIGVERAASDYVDFFLGNEIVGGSGFSSTLNQRIRQDNGLAYSVYSSFVAMQTKGPFWVEFKTESSQAKQALDLSLTTLNQFLTTGPSANTLHLIKTHIINSHPMLLSSNTSQLGYLGNLGFYGLPINTLTHFTQDVIKSTEQTVHSAWQRRFTATSHPPQWLIVTVGPNNHHPD